MIFADFADGPLTNRGLFIYSKPKIAKQSISVISVTVQISDLFFYTEKPRMYPGLFL